MDFETSKVHQDTWNCYRRLGFVSAHVPCNIISNFQLRWSDNELASELGLLSATTLGNICRREYALSVDAMKKQLSSLNEVTLALHWWTSTNKLAITSVIALYMDRNWAFRDLQLALHDVDHLFFSAFEIWLRLICQVPKHWSKGSCTFEGHAWSFWTYRRLFS